MRGHKAASFARVLWTVPVPLMHTMLIPEKPYPMILICLGIYGLARRSVHLKGLEFPTRVDT